MFACWLYFTLFKILSPLSSQSSLDISVTLFAGTCFKFKQKCAGPKDNLPYALIRKDNFIHHAVCFIYKFH